MLVYYSRFTPNLENGENVSFNKGEVVDYRLRNGQELKITIDSDLMKQKIDGEDCYGYESVFHDDNKRYFALSKQIINWEGKVQE